VVVLLNSLRFYFFKHRLDTRQPDDEPSLFPDLCTAQRRIKEVRGETRLKTGSHIKDPRKPSIMGSHIIKSQDIFVERPVF